MGISVTPGQIDECTDKRAAYDGTETLLTSLSDSISHAGPDAGQFNGLNPAEDFSSSTGNLFLATPR